LYSRNIIGSLEFERTYECENVAFEGGKSLDINNAVADEGVNGAKRILALLRC
jgi:hypothetical protein